MAIAINYHEEIAKLSLDFFNEEIVNIEEIKNGFFNTIFVCKTPSRKFLAHFNGNAKQLKSDMQREFPEIHEAVIVIILSSLQISPCVYGIFEGGRLEEFVEGRILCFDDLENENVINSVISQIVRIHQKTVPVKKRIDLFETFGVFANRKVCKDWNSYGEEYKDFMQLVFEFDTVKEYDWIKSLIANFDTPIVLSHNDLNLNNIMLRENTDNVVFIDYDMASYNHRTYDLAYFIQNSRYTIKSKVLMANPRDNEEDYRERLIQKYEDECQRAGEKVKLCRKEILIFQMSVLQIFITTGRMTIADDTENSFKQFHEFEKLISDYYAKKKKLLALIG